LIDPKKLFTYFNENYPLVKSSNGWWMMRCPCCNELSYRKKMTVNFNYDWVKCWVCGYGSSAVQFVAEQEGIRYSQARQLIKQAKPSKIDLEWTTEQPLLTSSIKLPYAFKSISEGEGILGKRARKYLTDRGFNIKELDRLDFGYIIIPCRMQGKLVYYIGRDYIGNFLRYKNPAKSDVGIGKADLIFNGDALNMYDEAWVSEGWSDAMTIGARGTATFGWSLSKTQFNLILKSSCSTIVLTPDSGVDGQGVSFYDKALLLASKIVRFKKVKVLDMGIFGAGADVNSVGKKDTLELYNKTDFEDFTSITLKLMGL
jgi:hypothetical protein